MIGEPHEPNILEPSRPDTGYRPERSVVMESMPRADDVFYGAPAWVFWALMILLGATIGLALGARY